MKLDFEEIKNQSNQLIKALTNLDDDIKDHLFGMWQRDILITAHKIKSCESPIEQLFAIYFLYAIKETGFADSNMVIFEPQYEIHVNGRNFRVDFMIRAQIKAEWVSLVVECDGFEFHETKTQATKDKQRERLLRAAGYELIRFSGSEIWGNPYEVVLETIEFMKRMVGKKTGKAVNQ
jgi:very-short-patch-repair endonuclease